MRLADWDAATTAHYRALWERANRAHLDPEPVILTGALASLSPEELQELISEPEPQRPTEEVEVVELDEILQAADEGDALMERLRRSMLRAQVLRAQKAAAASTPEKRRWRVLYALAKLLSTQPPILPPERVLREAITAHCESIGQPLRGLAKGIPEWQLMRLPGFEEADNGADGTAHPRGLHIPTPPSFEAQREMWAKVERQAAKIEALHGPIERLTSLLEPYRAEPEPSEATLLELWADAIEWIEREPANPVPARLIRYYDGEQNRSESYRQFELPKRRGGTRTITTPRKSLKWLQRSVLQVLTHLFPRHQCAVGFERGESVVSHAKAHAGKRWVYVVDIQDFFPSITRSRVYGMLRAKPFEASEPVARYLANLVTYDRALPQGAPTSPILANLLCRRMDARLFKWARERGYQYTRYADDLAFSTNRAEFPEEDRQTIREIIESEGFSVHPEKQKLMPWYGRQLVTGLVVNEEPNVPRTTVRALRALLRNVEKFGWASQVHRGQLFEDADAWMAYKRRALPVAVFRKLVAHQGKEHLLVRPGTAIRKAQEASDPVLMFQRVVRGRIEFVGAVRGKEDAVYLRLCEQYDRLVERKRATKAAIREGRRSFVPEDVEVPTEAQGNYKELMSLAPERRRRESVSASIQRMLEGEAGSEGLRQWLDARSSRSLEAGWLRDRLKEGGADAKGLAEAIMKLAHTLDTHPERTAAFFRQFGNGRPFRRLLHDPRVEPDAEGRFHFADGTAQRALEIVGACKEALRIPLPNPLREETRKVLAACEEWLEVHPNEHPYLSDQLHERLQTYKWEMRYENEPGYSLYERLSDVVDDLRRKGAVIEFDESAAPAEFYTYTPNITGQRPQEGRPPKPGALVRLLRSLAEKSIKKAQGGTVRPIRIITWYGSMAGQKQAEIYLQAHDGPVEKEKGIRPILSGDTQDALFDLRGLASWTMEVPYSDGSVHAYDVTTNTHMGEVAQPLPGFRHVLRFYQ